MHNYLELLRKILTEGTFKEDRTQTGTLSLFGHQLRFDLSQGFPLVTTKKVHTRSIIVELLWFLRGDTNIQFLHDHNVTIWDEWADEKGDLGPVYGRQWRSWPAPNGQTIDQLDNIIQEIKRNPDSRRLVVNSWNVAELDKMALAPCHVMFQFYVAEGRLSCQVYQRSADMFLGVPFNIASYALLTHLVAAQCDLKVGDLIWTAGDCHIYQNHVEQVKEQLSRESLPLPKLLLKCQRTRIEEYQWDDFDILDYQCHSAIKAPVAV